MSPQQQQVRVQHQVPNLDPAAIKAREAQRTIAKLQGVINVAQAQWNEHVTPDMPLDDVRKLTVHCIKMAEIWVEEIHEYAEAVKKAAGLDSSQLVT